VVACRCPRLRVVCLPGVDDVASVTVLGLPMRVKDPLPGVLPRHPRVSTVNTKIW
jgi:hypothetical protein